MSRDNFQWPTTYRDYDGKDENDIGPVDCDKFLLSELRKFFYSHVVIDKRRRNEARDIVEDIIKQFEIYTKINSKYQFGSIVRQGSSYEGLKVMKPNEFDLLVPIQLSSAELMEAKDAPGYYYIHYSGDTWQKFTIEGFLNPILVSREMQSIIQKAINFMRQELPHYTINMRESGPAKTLNINGTINIDIVPAVKFRRSYVVAKRHPKADQCQSKKSIDENNFNYIWRKSYSEKEKEKIRTIDKTSECHRACLKILKTATIMNCQSQLGFLSSYHLKTCMLHLNEKNVDSWHEDNLDKRFKDLIDILIKYLDDRRLPCFFNEKVNLFEGYKDITLKNIQDWLQKSIKNDDAIIREFLTKKKKKDDVALAQCHWDNGGEKNSDVDNGNEKDSDDYDENSDDYNYHDDEDSDDYIAVNPGRQTRGLPETFQRSLALDTKNSVESTSDGMGWLGKTLLVGAGVVGAGLLAAGVASILSSFKVNVYSRRERTTVIYRGLEKSLNVRDLKTKIMDKQGILVNNQRLRFNGMVLEDSNTLGSYGIGEDDTIVLETERICEYI